MLQEAINNVPRPSEFDVDKEKLASEAACLILDEYDEWNSFLVNINIILLDLDMVVKDIKLKIEAVIKRY